MRSYEFVCEWGRTWEITVDYRKKIFRIVCDEDTNEEAYASWVGKEAKELLEVFKELGWTDDFLSWFYDEGYDYKFRDPLAPMPEWIAERLE